MTSDYTVNGTERDERFDLSMQHMRSRAIDWKPVHAPCTQLLSLNAFSSSGVHSVLYVVASRNANAMISCLGVLSRPTCSPLSS